VPCRRQQATGADFREKFKGIITIKQPLQQRCFQSVGGQGVQAERFPFLQGDGPLLQADTEALFQKKAGRVAEEADKLQ